MWRQDCENLPAFSKVQKILTIYFFQIRYINLKVWRQNYQNICFVLHTFHLIHLAQDIRKVSMFCPPQYSNFFQGFEIWKYHKFCPPHYSFDIPSSGKIWKYHKFCAPHFSFDTPSSGQKKSFYVLSSPKLILFPGFQIWKYHKFCAPQYSFDIPSSGQKKSFYVLSSTILKLFWILHTFHLIHLAQNRRKVSMFCPPRYSNFFQGFEIWK